jgi:hypothetical protein
MTFWTFILLLVILGAFLIAQMVKLLNSDTKAGELARAFGWSIIERIRNRKDSQTSSSEKQ